MWKEKAALRCARYTLNKERHLLIAIEQSALELRDEREARSAVRARRRKARRKWFRGLGAYAIINAFQEVRRLSSSPARTRRSRASSNARRAASRSGVALLSSP